MTIVQSSSGSRRRGLHRVVVDRLGRRIVHGELAPGGVLPNEAELSAEMDVSRTIVREAIKVLAAKGLVESRPKTGTRVLARTHWNLIDGDILGWQFEAGPDELFFRDLFEVRSLIEPAAAGLAAERRTAAEADRLEGLVAQLATVVDDPDAYIAVDLALHAAILESTHNALLARMTDTISTALRTSRAITTQIPGGPRASIDPHTAVVEAIRNRQSDAAEAAMTKLVAAARRDLEVVLHDAGLLRSLTASARREDR